MATSTTADADATPPVPAPPADYMWAIASRGISASTSTGAAPDPYRHFPDAGSPAQAG